MGRAERQGGGGGRDWVGGRAHSGVHQPRRSTTVKNRKIGWVVKPASGPKAIEDSEYRRRLVLRLGLTGGGNSFDRPVAGTWTFNQRRFVSLCWPPWAGCLRVPPAVEHFSSGWARPLGRCLIGPLPFSNGFSNGFPPPHPILPPPGPTSPEPLRSLLFAFVFARGARVGDPAVSRVIFVGHIHDNHIP